jgi:hypothetical protein
MKPASSGAWSVSKLRVVDPQPQPQETPNGLQEGQGREEAAEVTEVRAPEGDEIVAIEDDPRLQNPETREQVRALAQSSGWAEEGGKIIRDAGGQVTGRTKWIPKYAFWENRPAGVTEKIAKSAVEKFEAGQKLNAKERAALRFLTDTATTEDWVTQEDLDAAADGDQAARDLAELRVQYEGVIDEDIFDDIAERVAARMDDALDHFQYLQALSDELQATVSRRRQAEQGRTEEGQGDFSLTGESQAELDAKRQADEQRAKAEADRLKAEETRRKADARRDDFNLSVVETNPEAQKAADRGQTGMEFETTPTAPADPTPAAGKGEVCHDV